MSDRLTSGIERRRVVTRGSTPLRRFGWRPTAETTMTNDNADDAPRDVVSVTTSEYGSATIQSNLLHGQIDARPENDVEFGVQIHQDGPDVALSAGSTTPDSEDDPQFYSYHGLTVEQARKIAAGLEEAADAAEEWQQKADDAGDDRGGNSLLRRLMG